MNKIKDHEQWLTACFVRPSVITEFNSEIPTRVSFFFPDDEFYSHGEIIINRLYEYCDAIVSICAEALVVFDSKNQYKTSGILVNCLCSCQIYLYELRRSDVKWNVGKYLVGINTGIYYSSEPEMNGVLLLEHSIRAKQIEHSNDYWHIDETTLEV